MEEEAVSETGIDMYLHLKCTFCLGFLIYLANIIVPESIWLNGCSKGLSGVRVTSTQKFVATVMISLMVGNCKVPVWIIRFMSFYRMTRGG